MLRGVDLSVYQQGVNYLALGGCVSFAYVKACDWNGSAWVQDAQLATHVAGLFEYAVPFGLYCFGHPSQEVSACAQAFTRIAEGWGAILRPVIDMESLSQGATPWRQLGTVPWSTRRRPTTSPCCGRRPASQGCRGGALSTIRRAPRACPRDRLRWRCSGVALRGCRASRATRMLTWSMRTT